MSGGIGTAQTAPASVPVGAGPAFPHAPHAPLVALVVLGMRRNPEARP